MLKRRIASVSIKTVVLLSALSLAACGGDKDDKKGSSSGSSGGADKAAPAKMEWKKVGEMGIEVQVPAGTDIDDKTKSAGFPTATLWASPTTFIHAKNDMFWPKDVAKAKADIQKDPNPFQEFTKEDVSADGYHLEFTLKSMMDEKKLVYGVALRSTIGGKQYDCGSNTSSEAERAKVLTMCKSLRPAK